MSGGTQDDAAQKADGDQSADPDDATAPRNSLPQKGLGVGLFWSILFMLCTLFSLVGGMSVWMVRIARAEDRALLERQE